VSYSYATTNKSVEYVVGRTLLGRHGRRQSPIRSDRL
jgi:hypothetical protein